MRSKDGVQIAAMSAERREVRDVVWSVLADHSSSDAVHRLADGGTGVAPELDRMFAELGWFGVDVATAEGGSGGGMALLQPVLEGCGWACASARIIGTAVLAAGAIQHAGTPDKRRRLLPSLVDGSRGGTAALPGVFSGDAPGDGITATSAGDGWRLYGVASHVIDLMTADVVVVAARTADGQPVLAVLDVRAEGVGVAHQPAIDRTRSLGRLHLDGAAINAESVLAVGDAARSAVDALVDRAAVAVAADALGVATRVVAMTADYAGQRTQFGRAIGSFQAVKHQLADALTRTELSRALVDEAADAMEGRRPDASVLASMAKEHACETAAWVAGRGIQLHGGIGYTWEHDMHVLFKRAKLDEALFGDGRWHRERITAAVTAK